MARPRIRTTEYWRKFNSDYYQRNKERINQKNKEWARKHRKAYDDYHKKYREMHKEEMREYLKLYYKGNKDALKEIRKENEKERLRKLGDEAHWERQNRYYHNNKHRHIHKNHRRARARNAIKGNHTCEVCGRENAVRHHFDYRKPLSVIFLCHPHHNEFHAIVRRCGLRITTFKNGLNIKELIEQHGT